MSEVFLYRIRNSDDRDCCAYIDEEPSEFVCDHYFRSVNLCGSCYSGKEWPAYDTIETILSKEQYERLREFSKAISDLGHDISPDDERYEKGMQLMDDIQDVYDVLTSDAANAFSDYIYTTECMWLHDAWNLYSEDIDEIFRHYAGPYTDRSVVGYVFPNIDELAREEAYSLGWVRDGEGAERYFDFEKFAKDLLEDETVVELEDGRVVTLNL